METGPVFLSDRNNKGGFLEKESRAWDGEAAGHFSLRAGVSDFPSGEAGEEAGDFLFASGFLIFALGF